MENLFKEISTLSELILPPYQIWESQQHSSYGSNSINEQLNNNNSSKIVDLFLIPTNRVEKFSINRLYFDLYHQNEVEQSEITVSGFIPLNIRGKKLFTTKEQVKIFNFF